MPLQLWIADPARNDGHTADGMSGDCFRTAIAGALGLDRDSVPHFVMSEVDAGWWWELQRWARERFGATVYTWAPDVWHKQRREGVDLTYPGGRPFTVLSGPSPRGPFGHAVVGDMDLNQIHDPHPLGLGLAEIHDVLRFVVEYDGWTPPPRRALPPGRCDTPESGIPGGA